MSLEIAEWVASALGVSRVHADLDSLKVSLDQSLARSPIPSVEVEDLVEALERSKYAFGFDAIRVSSPIGWRASTITVSGTPECELVLIGAKWEAGIPTSTVRSLLTLWFLDEKFAPDRVSADFAGNVVAIWWLTESTRRSDIDLALALSGYYRPIAAPGPSALETSTGVIISLSSILLTERGVYAELMQAALRQSAPSLRFLFLYRLFERAYLLSAMKKLEAGFFEDPKKTLDQVTKVVSNEKASFLSLVDGTAARGGFEQIENAFSVNNSSLANRFMIAIHKGASDDGDLNYSEQWKRGCVLAYKVRCSIVHSGKSAPIFESFSDASNACELLIPHLESAAMALLDVTIV